MDDLLTQITWVAEEQKLMANPKRLAAGTVIEAHLDKKKGPVATLLVQTGTLRMGDAVCAGASAGRVRTLSNAAGVTMVEAGPSIAVQLVGLDSTPGAGEEWQVGDGCWSGRLGFTGAASDGSCTAAPCEQVLPRCWVLIRQDCEGGMQLQIDRLACNSWYCVASVCGFRFHVLAYDSESWF